MTIEQFLADIKSGRTKKVILDTDAFNEIDDQYAIAYCYLADSIDLFLPCLIRIILHRCLKAAARLSK